MRQQIKDLEFYHRLINELNFLEKRRFDWLKEGKIPEERKAVALDLFRAGSLKKTILKYTFGESIEKVKKEFENVIKYANENWIGLWTLKLSQDKILNQYTLSGYDDMIWMLSLGYLLDINQADFQKLADLIDGDGVKDYLFEFIIAAKIKDRKPIENESYRFRFDIPEIYNKLRLTIAETDKVKAEKIIKEFVSKDWYKNHKGQGWYDCHKGKHDTYFGYWSFETAAIVKIMGLDDKSLFDCQYYPKDLVHQENS